MAPGQVLDRHAPVCCAAVESFVRNRHYNSHLAKVSSHKPTINNEWSQREEEKIKMIKNRGAKKAQQNEDRVLDIERENMRLLVRMHEIVHELRRIDSENQRLLKRLQTTKSTVNLPRIKKEAQEQQRVMRMRCERPQAAWREEAFIAKCASEGRFLQLPPEAADGAASSRSSPSRRSQNAEGGGQTPPRSNSLSSLQRELPPPAAFSPIGGRIPAASRVLADALMADFDAEEDRPEEVLEAAAETEEQALSLEEDVALAKEAAAAAFRAAEAVDVSSRELQYGDLVKRTHGRLGA